MTGYTKIIFLNPADATKALRDLTDYTLGVISEIFIRKRPEKDSHNPHTLFFPVPSYSSFSTLMKKP